MKIFKKVCQNTAVRDEPVEAYALNLSTKLRVNGRFIQSVDITVLLAV